MDNTTSTGNNETRSSGLGFTRLMLSRPRDSAKVNVDKSNSSNSPSIIVNSSSVKGSSNTSVGPLTRTLNQIGKLFNSGITNVSASVVTEGVLTTPTITRAPTKSLAMDTLCPMDESFSRSSSFGRTYSFTRCASFSHSNSFTNFQNSS